MAVDSLSTLSKANYATQPGGVVILGKTLSSVFNPDYITSLVSSTGSPDLCHASKPSSAYKSRSVSAQGTTCLPLIESGQLGAAVGKGHGVCGKGGPIESRSSFAVSSKHDTLELSGSRPNSGVGTSLFTLCERPHTLTPPAKPSSAVTEGRSRKCKSADKKKKARGKKAGMNVKRRNSRNSNGDRRSNSREEPSALKLTFSSLKESLTANCKAVKLYQQDKKKPKAPVAEEAPVTVSRKYTRMSQQISQQGKGSKLSKSLPLTNVDASLYMTLVKPKSQQVASQRCSSSPRPSQQFLNRMLSQADQVVKKLTKVYLSDKNSGVLKECGMQYPCAPPATPTPEQLQHTEYVPSLADLRAKRSIRQKLEAMERKVQSKLERERADGAKLEKQRKKEEEAALRRKQRLEIYALNKIMTNLENQRFLEFCKSKNIS